MEELNDANTTTGLIVPDYELILERIEMIRYMYENSEKTLFSIKKIMPDGFIVVSNDFENYVLFKDMPWTYYNVEYWGVIAPFLYNKLFYGTIKSFTKNPFEFALTSIEDQFEKAELNYDIDYEGVIIKKDLTYLLVDLGYHFNWKCGSIIGILNKSSFLYSNFNPDFEVGNLIKIKYNGTFDNGQVKLIKDKDTVFWSNLDIKDFSGLVVDVRYYKNTLNYYEFWVKDRYKGMLAFEYGVYGEDLIEVLELRNNLRNNDVIKCLIISINPFIGYFSLKWLAPTKSYLFWQSDEVDKLVGTKVEAKLIRTEEQLVFLINGLHRAFLPVSRNIYPDKMLYISKQLSKLVKGDVIECEVLKVKREHKYLLIKWLINSDDDVEWNNLDITELKKEKLQAKVVKTEDGNQYLINDKYKAILELNKWFYNNNKKAIAYYLAHLDDGDYIDCEIINIDKVNKIIYIKWINYEDKLTWVSNEIRQLISSKIWVRVVKKEGKEIEFFVNDVYKAVLPITSEIYINNIESIKNNYDNLVDFERIMCKVLTLNIKDGIMTLKWMLKEKAPDIWHQEEVNEMLGTIVKAKVINKGAYLKLKINEKYNALMPINEEIYPNISKVISKKVNYLYKGDTISCKIIGIEKEMGYFNVKWIDDNDE